MQSDLLSCWVLFFFKQKTAYEMRISDWSSDVCSSDLVGADGELAAPGRAPSQADAQARPLLLAGRVDDLADDVCAESTVGAADRQGLAVPAVGQAGHVAAGHQLRDRKSTRLNSSH